MSYKPSCKPVWIWFERRFTMQDYVHYVDTDREDKQTENESSNRAFAFR